MRGLIVLSYKPGVQTYPLYISYLAPRRQVYPILPTLCTILPILIESSFRCFFLNIHAGVREEKPNPQSMKAIRIHDHGGPEVLRFEDVPLPKPGPGEVLVRNHAIGVNFVDTYLRSGAFRPPAMPFIPAKKVLGRCLLSVLECRTSLRGIGWPS
jgi:hypothetical protein